MLEVCIKLNVRCVSAYAFSIENFKRSPGEVEALMDLAEEKLLEFCEQGCAWPLHISCTLPIPVQEHLRPVRHQAGSCRPPRHATGESEGRCGESRRYDEEQPTVRSDAIAL